MPFVLHASELPCWFDCPQTSLHQHECFFTLWSGRMWSTPSCRINGEPFLIGVYVALVLQTTWPAHLSSALQSMVWMLFMPALARTTVPGTLTCHLIFDSFVRQPTWTWFQFCGHSNSSSFPDVLAESPKYCTGSSNPSVNFIIYMHSLRKGAAKIGESVHSVEPFSIMCYDGFSAWCARCIHWHNFSLFDRNCGTKVRGRLCKQIHTTRHFYFRARE